jgi:hypothetical protein
MSHEINDADKKAIAEKKLAYRKAFDAGSVTMPDLAREYHDKALEVILGLHGTTIPPPPPECPPLPNDGRPQPSKGANTDPNTWKVVPMRDDPSLFKVVDNADINVADQFDSQVTAQQYINHFKCNTPQPCPDGQVWDPVTKKCIPKPPPCPPIACPPNQHWEQALCKCVPNTPPPTGQLGPYVSTGKELGATTRRATRHYASGKPDDETIEKNTKDIPYQNYQCIYYVTMHEIEHDDNVSSKLGGTHMGTGWLDHGVSFEDGKTCLGTEPDHPNTNSCIKVGANIGSIIEKRTGIATVYRKQTNYTELWTNTGSGWVKQLDATDLGGFNPNNSGDDEAQLRIDGFTDGSDPTIDVAVVQEIAAV